MYKAPHTNTHTTQTTRNILLPLHFSHTHTQNTPTDTHHSVHTLSDSDSHRARQQGYFKVLNHWNPTAYLMRLCFHPLSRGWSDGQNNSSAQSSHISSHLLTSHCSSLRRTHQCTHHPGDTCRMCVCVCVCVCRCVFITIMVNKMISIPVVVLECAGNVPKGGQLIHKLKVSYWKPYKS